MNAAGRTKMKIRRHRIPGNWKTFANHMFPSRPLEGQLLSRLIEELDEGSIFRDTCEEFCEMCAKNLGDEQAGLKWLNACHQFNDENYCPCTPLSYVLHQDPNDWKLVYFLTYIGADVDIRDALGKPPLYHVLEQRAHWKTADALVENGANLCAAFNGCSVANWAKVWSKTDETIDFIWKNIKVKCDVTSDIEGDYDSDSGLGSDSDY